MSHLHQAAAALLLAGLLLSACTPTIIERSVTVERDGQGAVIRRVETEKVIQHVGSATELELKEIPVRRHGGKSEPQYGPTIRD